MRRSQQSNGISQDESYRQCYRRPSKLWLVGYYQTFHMNSNQNDSVEETLRTLCITSTNEIYQNFMYIITKHPTTTANQNPIHFHQGYRRISSPVGSFNIRRFHIVASNLSGSVGFVNRLMVTTTNREITKITADKLNIF